MVWECTAIVVATVREKHNQFIDQHFDNIHSAFDPTRAIAEWFAIVRKLHRSKATKTIR